MKELKEIFKLVNIKTISADGNGQLSFFEGKHDVPFDIKRIYYISGVPAGKKRGYHAHKKLKQLLFCPYGEILITLDDGERRISHLLNDPSEGILIESALWREMLWLKKNSILCVAASEYYDLNDYIRNYDQFLEYKKIEGQL